MIDSLEERLIGLRQIEIPVQREREISAVIRQEIANYGQHRRKGTRNRLLSMTSIAAAVVAVVAVGALLTTSPLLHRNRAAASHGGVKLSTLHYKPQDIAKIDKTAKDVGVDPRIPANGLAKDKLRIVKNGGTGTLILDYVTFWVVETTKKPTLPPNVMSDKKVNLGNGMTGNYVTNKNQLGQTDSFFYFKSGPTYIQLENLDGGALSLAESQAIARSFRAVQ